LSAENAASAFSEFANTWNQTQTVTSTSTVLFWSPVMPEMHDVAKDK
jgi:hypothetical protein